MLLAFFVEALVAAHQSRAPMWALLPDVVDGATAKHVPEVADLMGLAGASRQSFALSDRREGWRKGRMALGQSLGRSPGKRRLVCVSHTGCSTISLVWCLCQRPHQSSKQL